MRIGKQNEGYTPVGPPFFLCRKFLRYLIVGRLTVGAQGPHRSTTSSIVVLPIPACCGSLRITQIVQRVPSQMGSASNGPITAIPLCAHCCHSAQLIGSLKADTAAEAGERRPEGGTAAQYLASGRHRIYSRFADVEARLIWGGQNRPVHHAITAIAATAAGHAQPHHGQISFAT